MSCAGREVSQSSVRSDGFKTNTGSHDAIFFSGSDTGCCYDNIGNPALRQKLLGFPYEIQLRFPVFFKVVREFKQIPEGEKCTKRSDDWAE